MNQAERKRIDIFKAADLPKIYRDLFASYHNNSDLLAELLQNAIDSIRIAMPDTPIVEITFYKNEKKVVVKDNGLGMSSDDLEDFALGRTNKDGPDFSSLGGEKGLGSSYIFGGSDKFYIETCKDGKYTIAECNGAYESIMKNTEPDFFVIDEETQERHPNFTELHITGSLFYTEFEDRDELESMIRTYTAVGYTMPLLGGVELDLKVKITWVHEDGEESSKFISNVFRHPINICEDQIIDFELAEEIDSGFGNFLAYLNEEKQAIAVFGESILFEKYDLPTGIFLSVKGYPTAVEINNPKTGYAGYWDRNILVLINDDTVELDAGRKSIRNSDKRRVQAIAKDMFNKSVKYHKKFIKQTESEAEKAILENIKEDARSLEGLGISEINYSKVPDYEQGVVAIFHELIGAGVLEGYSGLSASSDTRYDEIVRYQIPWDKLGESKKKHYLAARRNIKEKDNFFKQVIVVEFKLHANDIMKDIKKELRLIDLLVAYDCETSKIKNKWKWGPVAPDDTVFMGANYQIWNNLNDSCHVMLLKDFIETIEGEKS